MKRFLVFIIFLLTFVKYSFQLDAEQIIFPLLMPKVQPLQKDIYLCTAFRMPSRSHRYIVRFAPNASMATAHHILIYGCLLPGYYQRDSPRVTWDCSEMNNLQSDYVKRGPCAQESEIIYAWALDAPELSLPEGVGFKVGGNTGINFLVLQVHYANVNKFLDGQTDDSGVFLLMRSSNTKKVTKRAGVLLLGTNGFIPANSSEKMETSCLIDESIVLHPFAFRTHTHKLGKVVSGWRVRGKNWTLIGHHNPQDPQMFYPVENPSSIKKGDVVAARCTMKNYLNQIVNVGSTGNDEMCNFYLMYYVEGDQILSKKYCFSFGPPFYYWSNDRLLNQKVPKNVDKQASQLKK